MLRVLAPTPPLSAVEQYGLDVLLDLSRVLIADDGAGECVPVRVVGTSGTLTIAEARARRWGVEPRDGGVNIERALLALAGELAGAVAEQRTGAADRFGRVPPTENALVKTGDERDPVVNHMAAALRQATLAAADGKARALLTPWPDGKRWAMAMTHDIDIVALWPAYSAMRVGELAAHGDMARAAKVAGSALASLFRDPVWRATEHILGVEKRNGIRSTWFAIAGTPTFESARAGDVTYTPESRAARRIFSAVVGSSHEMGLHGSFASYTYSVEFKRQKSRLDALIGPTHGVRQHFLRMRPGQSHVAMTEAGFSYDSTYGFSERNGFRLGVADVIPVWDEHSKRALAIDEAPFMWMDRALSKYRHVEDPEVWTTDALAIAKAARQAEGLWVGIWHPNMDAALGFPDAPAAFDRLCQTLVADSPWATSLGAAVAWRRARRSARAIGVTPSGEIRLRATDARLQLEGGDGKPVRHVPA